MPKGPPGPLWATDTSETSKNSSPTRPPGLKRKRQATAFGDWLSSLDHSHEVRRVHSTPDSFGAPAQAILVRSWLLFQVLSYPGWIPSQIDDSPNDSRVSLHIVEDAIREHSAQQPVVIRVNYPMNAGRYLQPFDIGPQAGGKIITEANRLRLKNKKPSFRS